MCGIAGIIRFDDKRISADRLEVMVRSLAHRGPDGWGVKVWDRMGIGHRRLSIIDLETGSQPMSNEDGTKWITFNGEIYNYKELHIELAKIGHRFTSRSDTEVIIHAYEEWGTECLQKLRGMFAFAIVDLNLKTVFIARDHFGIKPLYYRRQGNRFTFASELHALKGGDPTGLQGDLCSVEAFLRFQYIPAPRTIYRNVFKLPAAHYLVIHENGTLNGPFQYWEMPVRSGSRRLSESQWIEKTESVVQESVKAHLVSDVPFGVFLSGGVDSSIVAWKMAETLGDRVKAFSIGFNEEAFSELEHAQVAAGVLKMDWQSRNVEETSLSMLPELLEHCGEPFGDDSIIPCWHLARLAREHVPMVLSGDGGDEGFGGYDFYRDWLKDRAVARFVRHSARLHVRSAAKAMVDILRFQSKGGALAEWTARMGFVSEPIRLQLWKHDLRPLVREFRLPDRLQVPPNVGRGIGMPRFLDYQFYLPDDILHKVDISSMCHGLEVRTPLIDREVVQHAWEIPESLLYKQDKGNFQGKYLLRKMLQGQFSGEFINRPKQGFALPRAGWFKRDLPGRKMLLEEVGQARSRLQDCFNMRTIETMLQETEVTQSGNPLWLLFVFSIWLNRNPKVTFTVS